MINIFRRRSGDIPQEELKALVKTLAEELTRLNVGLEWWVEKRMTLYRDSQYGKREMRLLLGGMDLTEGPKPPVSERTTESTLSAFLNQEAIKGILNGSGTIEGSRQRETEDLTPTPSRGVHGKSKSARTGDPGNARPKNKGAPRTVDI